QTVDAPGAEALAGLALEADAHALVARHPLAAVQPGDRARHGRPDAAVAVANLEHQVSVVAGVDGVAAGLQDALGQRRPARRLHAADALGHHAHAVLVLGEVLPQPGQRHVRLEEARQIDQGRPPAQPGAAGQQVAAADDLAEVPGAETRQPRAHLLGHAEQVGLGVLRRALVLTLRAGDAGRAVGD